MVLWFHFGGWLPFLQALGSCSEPHLITGMGYSSLKIPWEVTPSSFWCCCGLQARFVLEAWRAATTTRLLQDIFLNHPIQQEWCHSGACGVNFLRHGGLGPQSNTFASALTPASKLKSGIGAMPSWQNTLLNADLWLQPRKHFRDTSAFTVSSEDSEKEKTVLLLSWERIRGFMGALKWFY